MVAKRTLGLIPGHNEQDQQHTMRSVIRMVSSEETPSRTIWTAGEVFDQKDAPTAVGYAWRSWLDCQAVAPRAESWPDGDALYRAARQRDEITSKHDGTTVRAGAEVLADPNGIFATSGKPAIIRYVWAAAIEDIRLYVLLHGPVVMGTKWFEDMFNPEKNFLKVSGNEIGHQAWLIRGFDSASGAFLARLSWGIKWGNHGDAWIPMAEVTRLLAEDGEACTGIGEQFVVVRKSNSILEGS